MNAEKPLPERKGLTDITNSPLQPRPTPQKLPLMPTSKSHIEKLLQENAALIKLIEERDKSGAALQKLRVNNQKLQVQNTTLAKSNTQFLTVGCRSAWIDMFQELNSVKDKLRVLQHELVCKNSVPKARDMGHEEKVQKQTLRLNGASQEEEEEEAAKPSCDQITTNKTSTHRRRKNQQRQSLGAPSTREKEDEKLKIPSRRLVMVRFVEPSKVNSGTWQSLNEFLPDKQSGRFHTRVAAREENWSEMKEAKFPSTQPVHMPKPDQKLEITCSSPSKEGEESNGCSASGEE